jgi:hypothetical protein
MSLREIQEAFVAQLRGSTGPAPTLHGCSAAGLAVYRNAYRAQLCDTLRDTFATTHAWLGDDEFQAAAEAYVAAHPPHSWTLADYGDDFAASLLEQPQPDAVAGELAWLDWALRRAFDGPDGSSIGPEALADVDWERARLAFVPTLGLGAMSWNTAAIWSALAEGQSPPAPARLPEPGPVRVWRSDLTPQFCTISPVEAEALRSVLAGDSFEQVCERLRRRMPEADALEAAGGCLAAWIRDGLIAGFR